MPGEPVRYGPTIFDRTHMSYLGAISASSYTGELCGLIELIEEISEFLPAITPWAKTIVLDLDSAAVAGIALGHNNSKKELPLCARLRADFARLKAKLKALESEGLFVELLVQWHKAHCGSAGNELVDSGASRALIGVYCLPTSARWPNNEDDLLRMAGLPEHIRNSTPTYAELKDRSGSFGISSGDGPVSPTTEATTPIPSFVTSDLTYHSSTFSLSD